MEATRPDRSIDEGQVAAFLNAAYVQDIELSDRSRRPAIPARGTAIRTHQEAVDYMREVGERASRARKAQTARIAS
jgi:hypothetical protein